MQKTYNPSDIEASTYDNWCKRDYFKAVEQKSTYSIALPPPNVTGSLHMGHGFQDVLMDCLIRYNRMSGKQTLWQPGTDHAGIATQMVVEQQLQSEGKSRYDLGRDQFLQRVWQWKEKSGNNITRQMQRLGVSCDWSRNKFSMDLELSTATSQAFIALYEQGLIYRGKRLVNWDPELKTAISDLEVIANEEQGSLWHFNYPLTDGSGHVTIATTRPETMLGDTAIAVHPDDDRYKSLIGKQVNLPLTDRTIPIVADEYVDPEFGRGCVKITPAHDFNDYEVGLRHDLPLINIFTVDADINKNAPVKYQGLDRFAARKMIIADMGAEGLLVKTEPHVLKVPRNDRGHAIIEPYLSDQWYIKTKPLAKPAIEAVETGKIKFIPDNYKNLYFSWMHDIQDWCISRQLWWGHRIPAWYDENDNIYIGVSEEDVREKHKLGFEVKLRQDEDVLDTWFTAGLWPFSSLGWPEKTQELEKFYPTSVLVTGFDIIFFWVARMIMFGLRFMDQVPFKEVYIHGLIRDQEGQKMSKSKGNVIDPIDLIDGIELENLIAKRTFGMMQDSLKDKAIAATKKQFPQGISAYGTDALRFTYCALASTSRDICFDIDRMQGYRNFCNKLWNAARFVLMNVQDNYKFAKFSANDICLDVNKWIWQKLNVCIVDMHKHLANYRFDLFAKSLYDFIWNEYCDWYLEFSKVVLNSDAYSIEQKNENKYTLLAVLEQALRLAHPVIPFITENIWQNLRETMLLKVDSIMLTSYPEVDPDFASCQLTQDKINLLQQVITAVRTLRSQLGVKPSKSITLLIKYASKDQQRMLEENFLMLKTLAKLDKLEFIAEDSLLENTSTFMVSSLQGHIPLAGLIDMAAENERKAREVSKLELEIQRLTTKLGNEQFVSKAPAQVVAVQRSKLDAAKQAWVKLQGL